MKKILPVGILALFLLASQYPPTSCHAAAGQTSLSEGIRQYQQENYEEAVASLSQARQAEPTSSTAAFYLGMAWKQLLDYRRAAENFRDAVRLTPRISEALIDLIEVLYRIGDEKCMAEAEAWLGVAEDEHIFPAKTSFLKGLILQKRERYSEAATAFGIARDLDPDYSQPAELQIGLTFLAQKKLDDARQRFQGVIELNPDSDLAEYARQYKDLVEKRVSQARPLRLTLGVFGQYDTNLVLEPSDSTLMPPTDEASSVLSYNLRASFVPTLPGNLLFNAACSVAGGIHGTHSTTHDSITGGISISPGYNFGMQSLHLAASYNHSLLKGPEYDNYLGEFRVGPVFRQLLGERHLVEIFGGWQWNGYFQNPMASEEDRDSSGMAGFLSWIWLYRPGLFFNLRYEYLREDAEGVNWENSGHKVGLVVTLPLGQGLDLQLSGQYLRQDYDRFHTVFMARREDSQLTGTLGLTWLLRERLALIAQVTAINTESNIGIYDYDRQVFSLGLEYRY